jgi:hypothetical protein
MASSELESISEEDKTKAQQMLFLYGAYKMAAVEAMKNIHGLDFIGEPEEISIAYPVA